MRHRRRGAAGSFGAPLEKIVANFACSDEGEPGTSEGRARPHSPSLTRADVGESMRSAFLLNHLLRDGGTR
jgi:hypothetical protein